MSVRGAVRTAPCIDGVSFITTFKPSAHEPIKKIVRQPSILPTKTELNIATPTDQKPRLISNMRPWLAIIFALIVFTISCFVLYSSWSSSNKGSASFGKSTPVLASSDDEGQDETPVSDADVTKHKVAPDQPKIIRIGKIGVKARVTPMGVKTNNQLMAPKNIYDAGWYINSSKPGEKGAMLIDGHYSGPSRKGGVFNKIKALTVGDKINIEKGNGTSVIYQVQKIESVAKESVDMSKMLSPYGDSQKGLNIITCDGEYDKGSSTYNNRTILFATIVE